MDVGPDSVLVQPTARLLDAGPIDPTDHDRRIAPLRDLIDPEGYTEAAIAAAREGGRSAAVEVASEALTTARERVRLAFEATELGGLAAGRSNAEVQDVIISGLFAAVQVLHPNPNPTKAQRLSVVAVGGYGRGALAPGSDIDLLFLTPYKRTAWAETIVESMLYALWDLKQKVGQSTRSIDECLRMAHGDMTIRTSLLETRLICGDAALFDEMTERLWSELFDSTGAEFAAAKLDEREGRHRRAGDSRYLLEPNIKEGKGALRDLQSLLWIAKYLYRVKTISEVAQIGVLTAGEARKFHNAFRFLWTVRFWIHTLSGRAQEQLTFERQVEIAARMGYKDADGQRGVERFMKRYFWVAKEVGDLTRILCATLESQRIATKQKRGMLFGLFGAVSDDPVRVDYGRLNVADPSLFERDPLEILKLFETANRTNTPVHPVTLKFIRRNLALIDPLRDNPEAIALFMRILCESKAPDLALRSLNEVGVLGRLIPEFGTIVCMMQFNMYHHFTVDEHTIRAVGEFAALQRGDLRDAAPLSSRIVAKGINAKLMRVALLLHDIGKGRDEDHSIVGARIAADLCPRLGLTEEETETVVWLVRWHLFMSDVAQKRDISDFRTVQDFIATVQSRERLRMLLVLTVCDIRAVGPGVWNSWKGQLLRALFSEAEAMLSAGHDGALGSRAARVAAAKEALAARLPDWDPSKRDGFMARHYEPYWLGLDDETHEIHAKMLSRGTDGTLLIDASADADRIATRLCIAMADHPGLFSRVTGAVSLAGASIRDARTFTTKDGMALVTLWLQDRQDEYYDDPRGLERLKQAIADAMSGKRTPRDELRKRDRVKPRERPFTVAPHVHFDNTASELFTVIEVTGRDRLGLVHDLSRALTECQVSIFSAVVTTYGESAVDTFYVKDLFGHKITSMSRQGSIETALRAALAAEG